MKGRKALLIGVLGSCLALGAGVSVFAAGSPTTTGTFSFMNDLASHLGISAQTLKSAVQQTELDRVQNLLQNGKITQTQAQKLETNINSGKLTFHLGAKGHMRGRRGFARMGLAAVAKDIGMTPQALMTDLRQGQTLSEVITSAGKSTTTVEADLKAQLQTRLQNLVSRGKLTQAKEQTILQNFDARFQKLLQRTFPPAPPGPRPGDTQAPAAGPSGSPT